MVFYPSCKLLSVPFGCLRLIQTKGSGVLVTRLVNGYLNYIVIVSHDVCKYQEITLNFLSAFPNAIYELTPTVNSPNGQVIQPNVNIARILAPGGYLIFRYG